MAAITEYEKNRIMYNLRHWYKSHKQSMAYFEEQGKEDAAAYHKNQMNQLQWIANIVERLDVIKNTNLDSDDCPF